MISEALLKRAQANSDSEA